MTETDATYHLRWNLRIMAIVAMWPSSYLMITLLSYLAAFLIFVFYISDIILTISVRNDMKRLPICLGFLCGYLISVHKWCWFVKYQKQIQEIFASLTDCMKLGSMNDTSGSWKKALQSSSRTGIIVSLAWLLCIVYITCYTSFYPLSINGKEVEIPANNQSVFLITDVTINDTHISHNKTSSETVYMKLYFLPIGDWPFLDTSGSPAYEFAYFIQASGVIIHGIAHCAADCLFFAVVTLVSGQFEALIASLKSVGMSNNYSELLAHIHYHQQLIRTVELIDKFYSPVMLIQLFNAMLALCAFAFEASKMEGGGVKAFGQMQFFAATVIHSYIFCSAGSRMTNLSTEVADATYESNWADKPKFWKNNVEIMMVRAQKPLKLTGGPFYVISNETYLMMMQMSFSYYTFLSNVQVAEV